MTLIVINRLLKSHPGFKRFFFPVPIVSKHTKGGCTATVLLRNFSLRKSNFGSSSNMGPAKDCGSRFRLSDYDCIGFDLDNTVCEYKIRAIIEMEYDILAKYLVEKKGYDYKYMYQPLSEVDVDFFQRGLILDFSKGNVLQVSEDGVILQASHGTVQMSTKDIIQEYGEKRQWDPSSTYCKNVVEGWNRPLVNQLRTLLDYFDMPASLGFARAVDCTDYKTGRRSSDYQAGPDILEGLLEMYKREHFISEKGGYFRELKANPDQYINKCKPVVLDWLKKLKETKSLFLITGSNVDFASFTASYCLGEDWRSYFDIVICFARKPGFFKENKPFLKLDGALECGDVDGNELEFGQIYSQGNWKDLYNLLARKTGLVKPKCLYIGDNLVQDVYAPSKYGDCDTVAVIEELGAESPECPPQSLPNKTCVSSRRWGSYFRHVGSDCYTLWGAMIKNHAKICVPNLSVLASKPLDTDMEQFEIESNKETEGYHPNCPLSLRSIRMQAEVEN